MIDAGECAMVRGGGSDGSCSGGEAGGDMMHVAGSSALASRGELSALPGRETMLSTNDMMSSGMTSSSGVSKRRLISEERVSASAWKDGEQGCRQASERSAIGRRA